MVRNVRSHCVVVDVGNRLPQPLEGGGVDQHVEPAVVAHGVAHDPIATRAVLQVGRQQQATLPFLGHQVGRGLGVGLLVGPVADGQRRPLAGEQHARRPADTRFAAGDDGDAAVQRARSARRRRLTRRRRRIRDRRNRPGLLLGRQRRDARHSHDSAIRIEGASCMPPGRNSLGQADSGTQLG